MSALREYVKMKYVGDCKCGDCQLVPTQVLREQDAAIDLMWNALNLAEYALRKDSLSSDERIASARQTIGRAMSAINRHPESPAVRKSEA
jgi:hypothetical protein